MLMKKVLVFVEAKEEHPQLTKPQLCKTVGILDLSLISIMKDLNMNSFYLCEVLVNRKKTDLTINKKIKKGTKKLSLKGEAIANTYQAHGFVFMNFSFNFNFNFNFNFKFKLILKIKSLYNPDSFGNIIFLKAGVHFLKGI